MRWKKYLALSTPVILFLSLLGLNALSPQYYAVEYPSVASRLWQWSGDSRVVLLALDHKQAVGAEHTLFLMAPETLTPLVQHEVRYQDIAISRDGEWVAYSLGATRTGEDSYSTVKPAELTLIATSTHQATTLPLPASPDQLSWSPFADELAMTLDGNLFLLKPNATTPQALTDNDTNKYNLLWLDANHLAYVEQGQDSSAVYRVDRTGQIELLSEIPGNIQNLRVENDQLVFEQDNTHYALPLTGGTPAMLDAPQVSGLSPNGQQRFSVKCERMTSIFFGCASLLMQFTDAATGEVIHTSRDEDLIERGTAYYGYLIVAGIALFSPLLLLPYLRARRTWLTRLIFYIIIVPELVIVVLLIRLALIT